MWLYISIGLTLLALVALIRVWWLIRDKQRELDEYKAPSSKED